MRKDTTKIGIFGRSGCGKSTLAKKKTINHNRIVVYDAVHEYEEAGYKVCKTTIDIMKAIAKNPRAFRLAYQPQGDEPDYTEELKGLIRVLRKIQKPYADNKPYPKMLLICEEMHLSLPNSTGKEFNFFKTFFNKDSRHSGIDFIGICQRIAETSTNFRGNATEMYFYAQISATDIKTASDYIGIENAKKLPTLDTFCCFHAKDGKITQEKHGL